MAMVNRFLEKDIPYGKLANLGISKEKTLSMPKDLLETFLSGKVTPLIQAQVQSQSGKVYDIPLKLQLVQDRAGKIQLMTYPVRKEMVSDISLTDNDKERLRRGDTIRKEVKEDGIRRTQFIQMDNETKSLIKRNASNLRIPEQIAQMEKINDIQLGANQKQAIKEGKPIELEVGHEKVSVGVDLKEPQGFKVVKGDMAEWDRQQKIKYDIANEGFMGYVLTDQNRWEYKQVVDKLQYKEQKREVKEEQKVSTGMKL
ncbi:PF13101 family protein [Prevotella sp. BV3P1]|uniref:DUF4099 domain-containing protein n=1 Tax=Prevotella sp. BV3P1 TaxID=1111130 RepID=UPI0003B828EF|nr:DUF4099 domain-containing protein [Prevotella sp. BV3P1]ERT60312.1 PF13101 family protein [Prevotella sp. BV3P1]